MVRELFFCWSCYRRYSRISDTTIKKHKMITVGFILVCLAIFIISFGITSLMLFIIGRINDRY